MIKKRINPLRAATSIAMMFSACAGILAAVRAVPGGPYAIPLALCGGIVFTLIPASLLEWLVHRYIYHRRQWRFLGQIFRIHQQGHHAAIFPTWRYTTCGPVRRHPVTAADVSRLYPAGWQNLFSKGAHFAFYVAIGVLFVWLPAWALTHSTLFLASIVLTTLVLSDLFVRVHDAIHYPGQYRFIEAQPWYPFIDRHHFIHHVDMEANVNFLLPLADWCFGTLRLTLTEAEVARHGTLADAKASPLGHSEPAHLFLKELAQRHAHAAPPAPAAQADAG